MTSPGSRSTAAGMLAAIVAVLIWAGWIPVTRLGVTGNLHPEDIAALRYGTAGLVLLPFFWRHRKEMPWHRPGALLLVGVGAGVPYFTVFGMGLRLANSGQAAVFGAGASSLFTILLARIWLKEVLSFERLVGICCTVLGFWWVVAHDMQHGGTRVTGFGLIVLAALAWAIFTVVSRHLSLPPLLTAAFIGVANAALYLPLYLLSQGPSRLLAAPLSGVLLQAGYQGVLTGTVAMSAFTFAVTRLGAAGAALFTPMTPVLAGFVGWWLLGDQIDEATIIGLAAVALGVVIAGGALRLIKARQ